MAALTTTAIRTDGKEVFDFIGTPIRYRLTGAATSDTFTLPYGVRAWAVKPDIDGTADTQAVAYDSATSTFTIVSVTGVGTRLDLFVWPSVK